MLNKKFLNLFGRSLKEKIKYKKCDYTCQNSNCKFLNFTKISNF